MAFQGSMEVGSLILFFEEKNAHFVAEINTHKPYHKCQKMGLYVVSGTEKQGWRNHREFDDDPLIFDAATSYDRSC